MCGVAGVYAYSNSAAPVDREELRAVRDHMAARGPDGSGEWYSPDGRVGLAHRRLAIIDLSDGGVQPMASADGRLVISFNGEIYNYRELRAQLQAKGRVFVTGSDTEVLLQLYDEYGTAMLDHLRGMFTFALWDARKRGMLLARDPFGVKPLYYADDGKTLRVASQVKALLRAPVDTSPEPAGHAGFLLWGSVPSPWTLYRGIRNLPAGHSLWVGEQGAHAPVPYCLIADILAEAAAHPAESSEEEALEEIAAALAASVKAHLVSDVPVSVFLSAGLDSGMLCALTAGQNTQPRTLTLGFEEYRGSADDETPIAETLARQLGTRHTTMWVKRSDFEQDREKLLAAMDQPSIDGVNTWFVARAAASQGVKVALSGLGGDELFGSYPSFRDVPFLTRTAGPLARVPRLGTFMRKLSEPLVRRLTSPKYAGLLEYGGSTGDAYLLRRGLYMPWELPRVMDPDMARAGWRDLQTKARLGDTFSRIDVKTHQKMAISALEMSWYMRNQLLRDADWAGMAHSLEIRVPFIDVPLLKAAAPHIAAHPSITKRKVATAIAPHLPQAMLQKPKTGFSVPVREWLGASSKSMRGLRGWGRHVHQLQPTKPHFEPPAGNLRSGLRVLVSTLAPGHGGVNAMTNFVVRTLVERGLEPVVAHYAPYSMVPELSVPSFKLLQRRTGRQQGVAHDNREIHGIGAWLPELEFTHYFPTAHWRELMDSCDAFVAVSGNVLTATPFQQTGRTYLAWVATDWQGDRKDRVKKFPFARRLLDTCINTPVIQRMERKLLAAGRILSLSEYTARILGGITGPGFQEIILPVPVDSDLFVPNASMIVTGRLGFAGRFNDPRKNIGLLLTTVAEMRQSGQDVSAVLMGDTPDGAMKSLVAGLGLEPYVSFRSGLSRMEMRDCMQTLDVFILPSHQEGLCIAALEAMACGIPVVSTRCGGPEEFVVPGVTGWLVDSDAQQMANAIASIIGNRGARARMSLAARSLVEERYTGSRAEDAFMKAFGETFPDLKRSQARVQAQPQQLATTECLQP